MKNSKYLFSILVDFSILSLILSLTCVLIFAFRFLLYSNLKKGGDIYLLTEPLKSSYKDAININDDIFDPITKRKIGKADIIKFKEDGDRIRLLIYIDASSMPVSDSLRTGALWFEYTKISKEDFIYSEWSLL